MVKAVLHGEDCYMVKVVLHSEGCATWEALLSAMISLESENILKEGVIITERRGCNMP